jgi:hypothetical protein
MNARLSHSGLAALAALLMAACASAENQNPPSENTLKLGEMQLLLEERHANCFATATASDGKIQAYALHIPWPCQFHKTAKGQVRTLEKAGYRYVLVESSKPKDGTKDCDTQIRSVRAQGNMVEVSQYHERVASCPPFQWDEMLFRALFK